MAFSIINAITGNIQSDDTGPPFIFENTSVSSLPFYRTDSIESCPGNFCSSNEEIRIGEFSSRAIDSNCSTKAIDYLDLESGGVPRKDSSIWGTFKSVVGGFTN